MIPATVSINYQYLGAFGARPRGDRDISSKKFRASTVRQNGGITSLHVFRLFFQDGLSHDAVSTAERAQQSPMPVDDLRPLAMREGDHVGDGLQRLDHGPHQEAEKGVPGGVGHGAVKGDVGSAKFPIADVRVALLVQRLFHSGVDLSWNIARRHVGAKALQRQTGIRNLVEIEHAGGDGEASRR